MIRKLTILLALLLPVAGRKAAACDICGCGAGSNYLGILPDFSTRILGLRYRGNAVMTHVGPGGSSSYLTTNERYHTAELWGGWTFGNKFRVMATVPLSYNTRKSQEENLSKTGPGDASLQGFYHLLGNRRNLGSILLVQDLWIGGGVKLPTGKYEPKDYEHTGQNANLFQLGTGSFDFLLSGMYDLRLQDLGLNLSAGYKLNTTNKYDYNYGNRFSSSAQLYYKFRLAKMISIAPNTGISYERSAQDLDDGYKVFSSGGYTLFATAGAELMYRKLAFGGNWQPIMAQRLASGLVQARSRMMLHVALMF